MNQKIFNELTIAILVIGFVIVIAQNQIIINQSAPEETPLTKLMTLPEMQEFKDYQSTIEYLTFDQIQSLAEQYPDVYGGITKAIYQIELVGDKDIVVLYDYEMNKILNMFEVMKAEVGG